MGWRWLINSIGSTLTTRTASTEILGLGLGWVIFRWVGFGRVASGPVGLGWIWVVCRFGIAWVGVYWVGMACLHDGLGSEKRKRPYMGGVGRWGVVFALVVFASFAVAVDVLL